MLTSHRHPGLRRPVRPARVAGALAVGGLVLALAACGSQLSPQEVAAAQGGTLGGTAAGAAAGDGTVAGVDPGTGAVAGGGTVAGGTTGGAAAGGSTGSGSSAAGGTAAGGGVSTKGGSASVGVKAGSCDGFKNGPGITDSTITIGNSSDISGPVPGLFEAAQDATRAYVAYFNAQNPNGICGRKLVLKTYDSRTDAGADQAAYASACTDVFAMVGSMSAFDSGGAATSDQCGLPDIRSAGVTAARQQSKTFYGAQSTIANEFENAPADYVKKNFPDATNAGALLYLNAGASAENGKLQARAETERGLKIIYNQGIETSDFNYSPYVQQMKDKGIKYVQMIGAPPQFVRLAQAMQQQGFKPEVFMLDPTAYAREFIQNGGSAVEGATVFTNFTPFEEAAKNPEMATYLSWLNQVKPGAEPTFFGVFAWSAARLFVEQAIALGGKLNRQTFLAAMSKVDNWTCNDLHSRQHVGPRHTGDGWRFIQVKGGKWVPVGGTAYNYDGVTVVN